ncbi:MAG TPA: carboxypeptidase M32 [Candidatus Poseidoniales archaeon]|nr:MAG: carboxypeptidase M32 [Euryarchaeota archaeon]HHZ74012.1 carboxypeptidase M32 [Candidatus Poseidoniales archaeon]PXY76154.1 MAG: carboxypeptidase M32 [Euryarchaeota archaeon]PXY77095.1 MAG: carboxypeptidase M32 [Euryarchaeota archaeon]HIB24250.1 carboxypeptidase M32 [Candidatus Poseidoniales archaeon]
MGEAYEALMVQMRELDVIGQISGLLGWDQEVMMPPKAAAMRAEQLAWLSKEGHTRMTAPEVGELISAAESEVNGSEVEQGNIRIIRDSYDKATKKPTEFVEEKARHTSKSIVSWTEAREKNDFSIFRDDLAKMIDMSRQLAGYLGYEDNPYDALLDLYESGLCVAKLDPLFQGLRDSSVPLIKAVSELENKPDCSWVHKHPWPKASQEAFSQAISEAIGFDFQAGRRDESTHPFCGGSNPDDVRWTTRYDEKEPFGAIYGTMHETGHALYEQGRPRDLDFQPAGEANGLGVHESQSRLWENQVGRSLAFCEWSFPMWQEYFPANFEGVTPEMLWQAANQVEASLIRVEADEATYNLHVMIRYEIEKKLINGELEVDDLPDAWDDMYEEFLGVRSPTRTEGVLQDIHWSFGAFGYFPTYTLGNLYSAQLLQAAEKDIGSIDEQVRRGDFTPLLDWMRTHVHARGSILEPSDHIEEATGEQPKPDAFVAYLADKINALYGV